MSTFLTTTLLVSAVSAYTSEFLSMNSASLAMDSSGCNGSPYVCDLGEIASRMEGMFWCNNSGATLTYMHLKYTCNSDGSWTKQVAAPSYCDFDNQWQCWSPSNNCAVSPSSNCDRWCTCGGSTSSTAFRLGSALGSTAQAPQQALGHGRQGRCPTWLAAAQHQLDTGAVIPCEEHNRICKYPSYGMNFVCTNTYGFYAWALQGPAPTPTPAPPVAQCPSWWNIWNGKSCTCTNLFCKYNYVFGHGASNFVCNRGQWQKQGPAPTPEPTLPPVNNADCPSASIPPKAGTYCTTIGQVCSYSNAAFTCDHNGVWQSGTW